MLLIYMSISRVLTLALQGGRSNTSFMTPARSPRRCTFSVASDCQSKHLHVSSYLSAYAVIAAFGIIVLVGYNVIFMLATLRASRKIHQTLMSSLLSSTFR